MLHATDDEKADVTRYYLSQSPNSSVTFLQKVYSESVLGHPHDVWDVHASDGRWWIITNPTNLYSQEQFPNMDLAVTFHVGLCLRVPRTEQQRKTDRNVQPFADLLQTLRDATDALSQARNVSDYQAVGMRSREALLAFVAAAQDVAEWTSGERPQCHNFRAWIELICAGTLAGSPHKERRHLFRTMLDECWTFANWLTHAKSATWHDAEAALSTTEHALGLAISLVIRHVRSVPDECPACGSPHLSPEEGFGVSDPETIWERPACMDCDWTGLAVATGRRTDGEVREIFTRIGGTDDDECIIPSVPLRGLARPGEE